jgi:hypothetical protein
MLDDFEKKPYVQWPDIFDDKKFIDSVLSEIETVTPELHEYLMEKSKNFNFTDVSHMLKVECLIKHLGGTKNVDPSADDSDSSIGTFCMFVIRDALEHYGLLPERTLHVEKQLALCEHKKQLYEGMLTRLNACLD